MSRYDYLFGEIAVQLKLITREQLAVCLEAQRRAPNDQRLGAICVERGYLSVEQAQFIVQQQDIIVSRRGARPGAAQRPVSGRPGSAAGQPARAQATGRPAAAGAAPAQPEAPRPPIHGPATPAHPEVPRPVVPDAAAVRSRAVSSSPTVPASAPPRSAGAPPTQARPTSQPRPRTTALDRDRGDSDDALHHGVPIDLSLGEPGAPEAFAAQPLELMGEDRFLSLESPPDEAAQPLELDAAPAGAPSPDAASMPPGMRYLDLSSMPRAPAALDSALAEPYVAQSQLSGPRAAGPRRKDAAPRALEDAAAAEERPVEAEDRAEAPSRPAPSGLLPRALALSIKRGASDLHLHTGSPLLVRVGGELRPLSDGNDGADVVGAALTADQAARAIGEVLGDERWRRFYKDRELDFAYELPGVGRFRVNAYMQQRGPDIVFRLLPPRPPTLDELGLPRALSELTHFRTGMVLCTGPIGCGKSSTLAALLELVIQSRREHIITIEDPIEFVYGAGQGLVNQRQLRDHTSSFARALRAALREDPDVIGITELRDPETIALAISAAETGHFVLGSLHTGSAIQTVTRMINAFPADQQAQIRVMLSESLRAVISQRLLPREDGRGRVVALEVLVVTPPVGNLIREDKTFQLPSMMQLGKSQGMLLLDNSLGELVSQGLITKEVALRHAQNPQQFR